MALSPADLAQIESLITTTLQASGIKISALPAINTIPRTTRFPVVANSSTQGMSLAQLLAQGVTTVPVGQDLRAMDVATILDNSLFITEGVVSVNDGGGGLWVYDADSVATDNIGTVIAPDSGVGRFLRIYSGDIHLAWFAPTLGNDVDNGPDNDVACASAVAVAKPTGATIILPVGTLVISTHFPIRNEDTPPVALEDYNGITVWGSGRASIVKQWNAGGTAADVFNLNGVKNVNLLNFTITSQIDSGVSTSGTNAVSVINGGENILCQNIHAYKLPYILSGPDFDGGSAFTIQHAANALNDWNIRFINCSGEGDAVAHCGAYGINFTFTQTAVATNPPQGILVQGCNFREMYRGAMVQAIIPATTPAQIDGTQVSICDTQFVDMQQGFIMFGMTGVNFQDNQFSTSFVGAAGFNPADTLKYGMYLLTNYNCNVTGNICRWAESDFFVTVGGGATAEADTPTEHLNFSDNHFFGETDAEYGLMSTTTAAYGYTENSNFDGNTFQGQTGSEDYHPLFSADGALNAIVSVTGSYFPEVVQSTFSATAGSEQIGGWTQGGTPFSTLTVAANDHDITSLIAAGANEFAGWEINLTVGRVYEIVGTTSSGSVGVFTNATLGTDQNGSVAGVLTTTERRMVFQAGANDNFIVLKSLGAFSMSLAITLREVPINCQASLWVGGLVRANHPTFNSNVEAISAGLVNGCEFVDGSGFVHAVIPL